MTSKPVAKSSDQDVSLEDLRVLADRYSFLADHGQDVFFRYRITPNPGFEYASPGILRLTGYSADEHIADRQLALDAVAPLSDADYAALRDGTVESTPTYRLGVRHKNGRQHYVDVVAVHCTDPDGNRYLEGIARDVTVQAEVEQELGRRVRDFEQLAESLPDVIARFDRRQAVLYVNPTIETMSGLPPSHYLGKTAREAGLDPAICDRWEPVFEEILATGREAEVEAEFPGLTGTQVFNVRLIPQVVTGDSVTLLCVARNITQRRAERREYQEAQERFRQAFEISPDGITISRMSDGVFIAVNAAFCEMTGFGADELIGSSALKLEMWATPEVRKEVVSKLQRDGRLRGFHASVRRKDGTLGKAALNAAVLMLNGEPHMLGVSRDLTDVETMREELRLSEQRLQFALDGAELGLWDYDIDNERMYFSPGYARMLGADPATLEQTVGTWADSLPPEDVERAARAALAHARGETDRYEMEFRARHQNGDWRWILSRGKIAERGPNGEPLRMVGTNLDITDRKGAEESRVELEKRLRESHKMEAIGRLAGGIAHDFNNLLTGICGYLEMAIGSLPKDTTTRQDLVEAKKAADRAAALTQQLLAYSRKQMIAPRVMNLNEHIDNARRVLARLVGETTRLLFEPGNDLWLIRMDPGQVDQILIHLIANAVEAMPDGGAVAIRTENIDDTEAAALFRCKIEARDYVMMSIEDTGLGMDENVLDHVFEPFYSTKEVGQGSGLGLATIYGIVRQNHGFIEADSNLGRGSVFRIILPRHESNDMPEPEHGSLWAGHKTVLLAEDEEMVRDLAKRILESSGYEVLVAADGESALSLATENVRGIDLLLTDVVMPGINGRVLADRLRAMNSRIRVVYMSGYTEDAIAHHGVLDGDAPFLPKPFDIDSLLRIVREALEA